MQRSDFLAVTGLSIDQFNYAVRQGHLPYVDRVDRTWADYSLRQAFLTRFTVELGPLVGGQAEAARRVVEIPHAELSRIWGALFRPGMGDVLATSFLTTTATDNPRWDVERVNWHFALVDPCSAVLTLPQPAVGATATIPLLNLSAIMRALQARAVEAGIPFQEDADYADHV